LASSTSPQQRERLLSWARPAPADTPLDRARDPRLPGRAPRCTATTTEWIARLGDAKRAGRLEDDANGSGGCRPLIVDEIGYIRLEPEAANLMFTLVSRHYERASLIVTSKEVFSA
jgi:hypothetical protein